MNNLSNNAPHISTHTLAKNAPQQKLILTDEEAEPLNVGNNSSIHDSSSSTPSWKKYGMGAALVALVGYFAIHSSSTSSSGDVSSSVPSSPYKVSEVAKLGTKTPKSKKGDDSEVELFDDRRRFIVRDFDARSTFSNFLPGMAGVFGKPVWSFYVNRGQGIASFGLASKDFPIMEFNTANKAYQVTPTLDFVPSLRGHVVDTRVRKMECRF